MNIHLVVDLQYGSTGKGLLTGYLAETLEPTAVISANMPNAGHTYIDSKGQKMIHKVLPNGIVSPKLSHVFIGPGSVFWEERLMEEIAQARELGYLPPRVMICIHQNAVIMKEEYRQLELDNLNRIASTMQGSAAALIAKMLRQPDEAVTVGQLMEEQTLRIEDEVAIQVLSPSSWQKALALHKTILAEGSQGYSLGINQEFHPFCTSRECTPLRMMSEMALPMVKPIVYGTLRTFPIRVGNTPGGFSGGVYGDQKELSWDELGQTPEKTTVTQRVRRVFTFSRYQLEDALAECRPNYLFLNFCNYMDRDSLGGLVQDIDAIADVYGSFIKYTGHGPAYGDVRQLGELCEFTIS